MDDETGPMRRITAGLLAASAALAVGVTVPATAGPSVRFNAPVLLTIDRNFGGYEPSVTVDRFNNVYVTAHKQNHGDVLSPDSRATAKVRAQSWLWTSTDGKSFSDLPGMTPLGEQNAEFGDEGDLARDDAGHVYFVDTTVTDDSFSRYGATGKGKIALQATRPVGPFAEPSDDRPWIAAHGNGVVMYIGNEGNKSSYPAGHLQSSQAIGPGRFTVYMSYNGGDTFDPLGQTLNDSGWCRPAADHRRGSKDLYVLCTNDGDGSNDPTRVTIPRDGTLWAYSSHDDGKTWTRSKMGTYNAARETLATYPSVSVAPNGTIYGLYNQVFADGNGNPRESHLLLYTSTTKGRTWSVREITPRQGIIRFSWVDVAPNGMLGIGYYYRPDKASPWHVYAGTAAPGHRFTVAQVSVKPIASKDSGSPWGDFFQIAFGPDSKLHVVWTAESPDVLGTNSEIFYARQR